MRDGVGGCGEARVRLWWRLEAREVTLLCYGAIGEDRRGW